MDLTELEWAEYDERSGLSTLISGSSPAFIALLFLLVVLFFTSVADPHWFQCGSRSRVLMTTNLKKFTAEIFFFFLSKNAIYLSLGLHKGRLSYNRSLYPTKEKSGTSKLEFSSLWSVILALLDPDTYSQYGSGSATMVFTVKFI